MLIQCTKKLLDQLNVKPETQVVEDAIFSWHANLITVNRRKAVVLVNDKNRYAIVLYGLKAKDFKNLKELIVQAIRETFLDECIKGEVIEQFIHSSGAITYTKTKDRVLVARMNKACDILYYYGDLLLDGDSVFKGAVSRKVSRYYVGDGNKKHISPNEEMYKDLETFYGGAIFRSRALELKITLSLENHHVWRKLVVPVTMTFNQLHSAIQMAFGWRDYHLHEFYIFDDAMTGTIYGDDQNRNHSAYNHGGYAPIVNLVMSEDDYEFEDEIPIKLEAGIKLSEYLPKYRKLKYNYDFGDDWQHYIDVEKVIDDYDKYYPICLQGEGNAPPEDVGGEGGYEEFLAITADELHPEWESMVSWGKWQGFRDFDMESVNQRLKHI